MMFITIMILINDMIYIVYNLYMIYKDSEKYMKHLKKDIGIIKENLKTISANQTDSHQTLMKFLN